MTGDSGSVADAAVPAATREAHDPAVTESADPDQIRTRTYRVRITGTINDEVEVEAGSRGTAQEQALMEWRYVEFEDLVAGEPVELL